MFLLIQDNVYLNIKIILILHLYTIFNLRGSAPIDVRLIINECKFFHNIFYGNVIILAFYSK